MACNVGYERLGERVHEVEVGAACRDAEVDIFFGGRHIALNIGHGLRSVVGCCVDVDLFLVLIPVDTGNEGAHPSVFKLEFIDGEVGKGIGFVEGRGEKSLAGCLARE